MKEAFDRNFCIIFLTSLNFCWEAPLLC